MPMHLLEVSAQPIQTFLHLSPVAIVSGHHSLFRLANILDLTGQTGHINDPGRLAVVVPPDGVLPSSLCASYHVSHLLHPGTADTSSLGMQAVAARWVVIRTRSR